MSKIKAVLFDFDGTIIDTNQVILNSWKYTMKKNMGYELPYEEVIKTFGVPLIPSIAQFVPPEKLDQTVEDYRHYQHTSDDWIGPFEGMVELIKELKERGYILGIVTSRTWKNSPLERYNFVEGSKYFDVIVSEEMCSAHKPDPQPILMAMEKLGLEKDEAIYIGDSKMDTLCAKNAGIKTVLVGWSLCCPKDQAVDQYEPDFIIDKPADLLDII